MVGVVREGDDRIETGERGRRGRRTDFLPANGAAGAGVDMLPKWLARGVQPKAGANGQGGMRDAL